MVNTANRQPPGMGRCLQFLGTTGIAAGRTGSLVYIMSELPVHLLAVSASGLQALPIPLAVFELDTLISVVTFLLAFSLVIFVHELGHFAVAKYHGIRVQQFSIGLPPRLVGFKFGETDYCIGLLPIGGYVSMAGQSDTGDPAAQAAAESDPERKAAMLAALADPSSFNNKSVGARAAVLSAGVIMNLIFGFALFIVIFQSGEYVQVAPVVGELPADMPAARLADAGRPSIEPGDRILTVNGTAVSDMPELQIETMLSDRTQPIRLTVERAGRIVELSLDDSAVEVLPGARETESAGLRKMGFRPAASLRVPETAVNNTVDLRPGDTVLGWRARATSADAAQPFQPVSHYIALHEGFVRHAGEPVELEVADAAGTRRVVTVRPMMQSPSEFGAAATGLPLSGGLPASLPDGIRPVVVVRGTLPGSPAERAGLRDGDLILAVNGVKLPSPQQIREQITAATDKPVELKVRRSELELTVVVIPERIRGESHPQVGMLMDIGFGDRRIGSVPSLWMLDSAGLAALAQNGVASTVIEKLSQPLFLTNRQKLAGLAPGMLNRAEEGQEGFEKALATVLTDEELTPSNRAKILAEARRNRADRAGLRSGDVIVRLGHQPINTWEDLARAIYTLAPERAERDKFGRLKTRAVPVVVERTGVDGRAVQAELTLELLPRRYELYNLPVGIPIAWEMFIVQHKADSPFQAVEMGLNKTWYMIKQVYGTLLGMFRQDLPAETLSGPVGIVAVGTQVAQHDPWQMWYLLAAISINLAVLNLLPIPVLDGGHLMFLACEKIRGKPLPPSVIDIATLTGTVLLLLLLVTVTCNDVSKLAGC